MAYAKIADTDKLKTFSELAAALSKTFNYLSKDQRLIDLYLECHSTDIFTRKLYPHQQWIHEDLQELQMLYGQGVSSRILPIHQIADTLESDVNSILPAVHV